MKTIARNVLSVILGYIIGSVVNMTVLYAGMAIIPLPDGADVSTPDGLRESMSLFTPANFLPPLMAHAIGTFFGAFVAAKISVSHRMKMAFCTGGLFFLGSTAMIVQLGGPPWFIGSDLVLAYFPTAYLGGRLATGRNRSADRASEESTASN